MAAVVAVAVAVEVEIEYFSECDPNLLISMTAFASF
jgi:hypothetical protein